MNEMFLTLFVMLLFLARRHHQSRNRLGIRQSACELSGSFQQACRHTAWRVRVLDPPATPCTGLGRSRTSRPSP